MRGRELGEKYASDINPNVSNFLKKYFVFLQTEDYLKRKIKSRPERSELIRMHILAGEYLTKPPVCLEFRQV